MLELSDHFSKISWSLLLGIVTEKLGHHKFCACWMPQLLTNDHKTRRMGSTVDFPSQHHFEGEEFLDRRWNLDCLCESWDKAAVSAMETYRFYKQAKEYPQTLSVRKVIATVFWAATDNLLVDFMECGRTITSAAYCDPLKKWRAVQHKCCGLVTRGVVFVLDNIYSHTAQRTNEFLASFTWDIKCFFK